MNALATDLSALQSLKNNLDRDLESQNRRVSQLEGQIQDINRQVGVATAMLHDAGDLDSSLNSLSYHVRAVQLQLLDMKQKLDGLKSTLEERRDRSTFKIKRAKLLIDKGGRADTMLVLSEMAEHLASLRTDVSERHQGLLAWK